MNDPIHVVAGIAIIYLAIGALLILPGIDPHLPIDLIVVRVALWPLVITDTFAGFITMFR